MDNAHNMPPWGTEALDHRVSLPAPARLSLLVSPCALVSLEAKQKLCCPASEESVQDEETGFAKSWVAQRRNLSLHSDALVWIVLSGIWVKFKMGMLYHLLWLICCLANTLRGEN